MVALSLSPSLMPLPSATATPCRPGWHYLFNLEPFDCPTTAAPCCSAPPSSKSFRRQAHGCHRARQTLPSPSSSRADGADVPSSTPRAAKAADCGTSRCSALATSASRRHLQREPARRRHRRALAQWEAPQVAISTEPAAATAGQALPWVARRATSSAAACQRRDRGPAGCPRRAPAASSRRCRAAARGSARRRQPPVPPARRMRHHPPVRRLPDAGPSGFASPASGAPSLASRADPRRCAASAAAIKRNWLAAGPPIWATLAVERCSESVHWAPGRHETSSPRSCRPPELGQRPRRSAPAVPAQGAGPEAGQGDRARRGAPLVKLGVVPQAATKPQAGAPALTLVFDRRRVEARHHASLGTRTSRATTGRRRISAPSGPAGTSGDLPPLVVTGSRCARFGVSACSRAVAGELLQVLREQFNLELSVRW